MGTSLYGYASPTGVDTGLIRFGGAGLGNLLFSWARCSVFCKVHRAAQIQTTWPQLKAGAWLRGEADKRHYCGLFHALPDEISGVAKLRLLYSLPRTSESEWGTKEPQGHGIVVFRDNRNYFRDIPAQHYVWLRDRFLASLSDRTLARSDCEPHIGIHIRLGDHPAYDPRTAAIGNMQLPVSWYVHVIRTISAELSWKSEIGICSDAREDELKAVLSLPNVRLVRGKTAQDDLMYLARSCLIVGSISTFSQWAAYLSGRPSIWHPQFDRRGGLGNGSVEMIMSQGQSLDRPAWKRCMEQVVANQCIAAFSVC